MTIMYLRSKTSLARFVLKPLERVVFRESWKCGKEIESGLRAYLLRLFALTILLLAAQLSASVRSCRVLRHGVYLVRPVLGEGRANHKAECASTVWNLLWGCLRVRRLTLYYVMDESMKAGVINLLAQG